MLRRTLAAALAVAAMVTTLVAYGVTPPTANAAPSTSTQTSQPGYQHKVVRRVQMDAARCAATKQAYPQYANNPDVCTIIITSEYNDPVPGSAPSVSKGANSVAPLAGCYAGTQAYHDTYTEIAPPWELDLDTQFQWNGDCNAPTGIISGLHCYVGRNAGANITNTACYYWNPASGSTQGKGIFNVCYTVYCFSAGLYRTCYREGPIAKPCYQDWF